MYLDICRIAVLFWWLETPWQYKIAQDVDYGPSTARVEHDQLTVICNSFNHLVKSFNSREVLISDPSEFSIVST